MDPLTAMFDMLMSVFNAGTPAVGENADPLPQATQQIQPKNSPFVELPEAGGFGNGITDFDVISRLINGGQPEAPYGESQAPMPSTPVGGLAQKPQAPSPGMPMNIRPPMPAQNPAFHGGTDLASLEGIMKALFSGRTANPVIGGM